jgi:hypothetical protein
MIKSYTKDKVIKKERQYLSYVAWDKQTENIAAIHGNCAVAVLNNLNMEDQKLIWDTCGHGKDDHIDFHDVFETFENNFHSRYDDDYSTQMVISKMQEKIKSRKETKKRTISKTLGTCNEKRIISKDFDTYYNLELLFKTAKCLDNKRVQVYFPTKKYQPIMILGNYGKGFILPIMDRFVKEEELIE